MYFLALCRCFLNINTPLLLGLGGAAVRRRAIRLHLDLASFTCFSDRLSLRLSLACFARCLLGLSGSPSDSELCSSAGVSSSEGIPNETLKDPGAPSLCPPTSSPSLWDPTLPLILGPPTLRMPLPALDAAGCCKMTSTCLSIEGELSTTPCWLRGSLTEHGT